MTADTVREALKTLEHAATAVAKGGAQSGSQWVYLTQALMTARAALVAAPKVGGSEPLLDALRKPPGGMLEQIAFNLSAEFGPEFVKPLGDFATAVLSEAATYLAALAQPAHPEGWQTMDSAPKDGTPVIVSDGLGVYGGAWWHVRDVAWIDCDGCTPTVWQPLPLDWPKGVTVGEPDRAIAERGAG